MSNQLFRIPLLVDCSSHDPDRLRGTNSAPARRRQLSTSGANPGSSPLRSNADTDGHANRNSPRLLRPPRCTDRDYRPNRHP